jgi:hypothetical protein
MPISSCSGNRTSRVLPSLLLAAVLAVGWLAVGSLPARAGVFEQVDRFASVIEIQANGSIHVTETIDYDFGRLTDRHGVKRILTTTQRYDDEYDRRYPLRVLATTMDGQPVPNMVADESGGQTEIKIGDANRTVSGRHRYTLEYSLGAVANAFDDHDELYWNVTGDQWDVTLQQVRIRVDAPKQGITAVKCFQGPYGSDAPCQEAVVLDDGASARYQVVPVPPGSGVTVVAMLRAGSIDPAPPVLKERWSFKRAFAVTPVTSSGFLLLSIAAIFGGLALVWGRGRDRQFRGSEVDQAMGNDGGGDRSVPFLRGRKAAPVEFTPPEQIRPGQAGTLLDERAETLDATATIVDLAVRGFLRIEEAEPTGNLLRKKPDWRLVRSDLADTELLSYERKLLAGLFETGTTVLLSDLREAFHERLEAVKSELYDDAVRQGWFTARPDRVRAAWLGLGIGLIALGAGVTWALAYWTTFGLLGLPFVIAGLWLTILHRRMPARTAKGTAMLRRVRGFREVIRKAETHMAQWAEKEQVFTRYLPYAVVFGCTDRWAKAFEALGIQPDTSSWYVSSQPFMLANFGRSMDGFASSSAGAMAATPGGSGSSGGGGFSGGGGGGGGGGSW